MQQHEIDATIEFHRHELGLDTASEDAKFQAWLDQVGRQLSQRFDGIETDLDGNQNDDGYSIDLAVDFYQDGADVDQAVSEFSHLIDQARE